MAKLRPVTVEQLKKTREVVATGPSGNVFRIRPMNLERHALSGQLPPSLRKLAASGAEGLNEFFAATEGEDQEEKNGRTKSQVKEVQDYLDNIVRQVIVEPDLNDVDLDVLHPIDYRWAAAIAMGEEDKDGQGRLLWGLEPLSRWEMFRRHHECAEDCEKCKEVMGEFQAWS
jgi:hypothetical protein